MDIHQTIARNVRYFRNLRELSQEQLAEYARVDRTYVSKVEAGNRNTTAETISKIAKALDVEPHVLLVEGYPDTEIGQMEINLNSLAESVANNPSLRSFIIGYQAEYMAKRAIAKQLGLDPAADFKKYDDHDRTHHGDIWFTYKGREYSVEVKSLQSRLCVYDEDSDSWSGKYQCDGSDATDVTLPNGSVEHTVAIPFGLFDFVCVGLFSFGGKWRFAFAKCEDLQPMSAKGRSKISVDNRKYFIKTMQDITMPLKSPYTSKIVELL